MSVSTGPGDCLRHRCSSAYLRISLLHAEFHPPLPYSSYAVTNAVPCFIPLSNEIKQVTKDVRNGKKELRGKLNQLHNEMSVLIRKRKQIGDATKQNRSEINGILGQIKAYFSQVGSSAGLPHSQPNESVYQMMHRELRYREPITYEAMAEGVS